MHESRIRSCLQCAEMYVYDFHNGRKPVSEKPSRHKRLPLHNYKLTNTVHDGVSFPPLYYIVAEPPWKCVQRGRQKR